VEKNKMKIEKKIVALCMCALVIGIATALPLTYFTPRIVSAQNSDPMFDIRPEFVYFSANVVDDVYQCAIGVGFTPLIDFDTFNPHTVAKIEYYEFVYYTDNQELGRTSHFIGANYTYVDDENIKNFTSFSRASWFENNFERTCYGYWNNADSARFHGGAMASLLGGSKEGSNYLGFAAFEYDDNEPLKETNSAILMALENKQTIYMDVIRVGYTTFDDNNNIVVAYTNDPIIQRFELTKNGDAYTFGNEDVLEDVILGIERMLSTQRERGGLFPHLSNPDLSNIKIG
jgi:hypothetical protein